MVSREDYNIDYAIYLAESETIESIVKESSVVNESIIQEGFKDTIMKYMEKIVTGIQNAWNKFKRGLPTEQDKQFLRQISGKVDTYNGSVNIKNYETFKLDKFNAYTLKPFNYAEMKEYLKTKNDFVAHYYPDLAGEAGVKKSMMSIIVDIQDNAVCDNGMVQNMFKFCNSDYETYKTKISNDIDVINATKNEITSSVTNMQDSESPNTNATATSTVTAQNAGYEFLSALDSILNEVNTKETEAKNISKNKMKITDNDGNDASNKAKSESQQFTKAVTNYMKASTEIMSTKMKIINRCYRNNMFILKNVIPVNKKNKNEAPDGSGPEQVSDIEK